MAAEIRTFTCLSDNFGYLIHDPETKATASIDAPEAGPVIAALEREGWTLSDILVTHHHHDHVGGVAELKRKYQCRVVAPHDKSTKIADVDLRVAHGDVIKIGNLLTRVLETPGHTLDHISYVFDGEKALFAADTLFSIGCGRVFEGTYPMMWDSLLKLRALPDDFKLYCGHEYTASNVKFALTVEPDNAALKARAEEVTRLRAENKPTIPVALGEENWVFSAANGEHMEVHLKYERGPGRRNPTQEVKFYDPKNPSAYQIFKVDSGLDIMKNVSVPVKDRVKEFSYKVSGGSFAPLFDGSEKVLSWDSFHWYNRGIYTP